MAGAVARLGSGAVDVSNVYAMPGHQMDWAELSEVIAACGVQILSRGRDLGIVRDLALAEILIRAG